MRLPTLIFLFVWAVSLKAQVNLVPNPSFEEYIGCPTNGSWVRDNKVPPWKDVGGGGVRFFHECGLYDYVVPVNYLGGQNAKDGQSYLGLGLWALYSGNGGRFTGVELSDSLISGKRYNVKFYLSLCDSSWYAIKNLGAFFSLNQPPENFDSLLSYEPQIKYENDTFLYDKENWIEISGSFLANGGEKFMTIGNFDGNENTDTLFVAGPLAPSGQPDYYKVSIYFIDDVSVTLDTTTGIPETEKPKLKIFPNPAGSQVTVAVGSGSKQYSVEIYDALGRLVTQSIAQGQQTTISLNLSKGVYLLRVKEKEEVVFWEKLIIE